MTFSSSNDHFDIQYLLGAIKIIIPGQKKPKQLFFLGIWLIYWLLVLGLILFIGYQLVFSNQKEDFDYLRLIICIPITFGILIWGSRGVMGANIFLRQIVGMETLEINPRELKITQSMFGIGNTKIIELDHITSIELGNAVLIPFAFTHLKSTMMKIPVSGPILVRADGKTAEYLGFGLETQEAEKIAAFLKQQLPARHESSTDSRIG